ncbi:MAG: J domain-containing protein, partial [Deltaproteobacteria bacterium]
MSRARSLKVRCSTWDQVEQFYETKMRADRTLVVKVPFSPHKGDPVTIALVLPDDVTVAIDATVAAARPAPDGRRAQVLLSLSGMTDDLLRRLRALVAEGRAEAALPAPPRLPGDAEPSERIEPPPAEPADAPVDEIVDQRTAPAVDAVRDEHRDVFLQLEAEHRRLRAAAAHEVLGVAWDAGVSEIRRGYFRLVKRFHPDVYARYDSDAIAQLAEEVFIHINKAYDRMRDAAAAAGKAIAAGPALLPHDGWIAGLEDVADAAPAPPAPPAPPAAPAPPAPP